MLVNRSAYKWEAGFCMGEVMDFPSTISCGNTLDEARTSLAGALQDMAETNLLRGEPVPILDSSRSDFSTELEEPIYLLLQTSQLIVSHEMGRLKG